MADLDRVSEICARSDNNIDDGDAGDTVLIAMSHIVITICFLKEQQTPGMDDLLLDRTLRRFRDHAI